MNRPNRLPTAVGVLILHLLPLAWWRLQPAPAMAATPTALEVQVIDPPAPPSPPVPVLTPPAPTMALPPAMTLPAPEVLITPTPTSPAAMADAAPRNAAAPSRANAPPSPERASDARPTPREADAPVAAPRSDASHLNNPAPPYPAVSRRMGEQGRVLLDVFVQSDGRVGEVRLHRGSGYPLLDDAAISTVRRWRYVPAQRGAEALSVWYVQQVDFVLGP